MNKMAHIVLALLFAAAGPAAMAEAKKTPGYQSAGVVDSVDFKSRVIIIDDTPYQLGPNVLIHGRNGKTGSYKQLRPGVKIGLALPRNAGAGNQRRVVHEVWLLPERFDLGSVPGIHFKPTPTSR